MGEPMSTVLYIVCEPKDEGRPLALARIEDREALIVAARAAVSEAEARARVAEGHDELLSELRQEAADRLRSSLEKLIPDLTLPTTHIM
jgi:hypothetical protein